MLSRHELWTGFSRAFNVIPFWSKCKHSSFRIEVGLHVLLSLLSSLRDLYTSRCRACRLMKDPHQPNNRLVRLLCSGCCLPNHAAKTRESARPSGLSHSFTTPCPPYAHTHIATMHSYIFLTLFHIFIWNKANIVTYLHKILSYFVNTRTHALARVLSVLRLQYMRNYSNRSRSDLI